VLCSVSGCFSEQAIRLQSGDLVSVPVESDSQSVRQWLVNTHQRLQPLLPASDRPALLTEDLVDPQGRPIDVFDTFKEDPASLHQLVGNFHGLLHSAQGIGQVNANHEPPPTWPGFGAVRIGVDENVTLAGRLGFAVTDGVPHDADCIVILPGLFGDNSILRTRDLADALRQSGFHVLALELRGHGQTEEDHPDVYYTFGTLETGDLMAVSEWLEAQPSIRRTGLFGVCWGANLGMLAAWYDGRPERHASITDALNPHVRPVNTRRHFTAGVIGFSPVLRFEELIDQLDAEHAYLKNPVLYTFQNTIRARMALKRHPEVTGSLRHLIEYEFARSALRYRGGVADGSRFLRFLAYDDKPTGDKLDDVRVPVLLIHGVNDPLAPAQDLADLMAEVDNPNVAGMVLPGGGHVGFAPYARAYYYSLILNFFDPVSGAAATCAKRKGTVTAERIFNHAEDEKRSSTQ
jgi:predicted alpha/beta-fold hydrolase